MEEVQTFQVKITSPEEVVWQGEATSISSQNSTGPFDVLPGHANFVTLVNPDASITLQTKDETKTFLYSRAVVSVRDGFVSLFVDI